MRPSLSGGGGLLKRTNAVARHSGLSKRKDEELLQTEKQGTQRLLSGSAISESKIRSHGQELNYLEVERGPSDTRSSNVKVQGFES